MAERAPWFSPHLAGVAALLALLFGCVSAEQHQEPAGAIRIGTTLPFSGERAASGVALERARRFAIDTITQAGGLQGRPLALVVRDSHSGDDERGAQAALEMLSDQHVPFFIGPEEPAIAYRIANAIRSNSYAMVNLLPGLSAPEIHDDSTKSAWFRLSPSPNYLACALAKLMIRNGVARVNAVTDPDDYSGTFATIFGRVFTAMGGTLLPGLQLPAGGSSFDEVFATVERFTPDATVLITTPSVGAEFLQEWAVRGKVGTWYLGPTLRNPALLINVPAGVLEGLRGISPDLGDNAADFDAYFEDATGVPPLAGSHYYFDAVALLALAIADGFAHSDAIPPPGNFMRHLQNVTAAPDVDGGGTPVPASYRDLAAALAAVTAGVKVQYSGAAGQYSLSDDGDSIKNEARMWVIQGNAFHETVSERCTEAEVLSDYTGKKP